MLGERGVLAGCWLVFGDDLHGYEGEEREFSGPSVVVKVNSVHRRRQSY